MEPDLQDAIEQKFVRTIEMMYPPGERGRVATHVKVSFIERSLQTGGPLGAGINVPSGKFKTT